MERSQDSCLVIRPDSGDPAETLIEVNNSASLVSAGEQQNNYYLNYWNQAFYFNA